jgi:hypothetical protein
MTQTSVLAEAANDVIAAFDSSPLKTHDGRLQECIEFLRHVLEQQERTANQDPLCPRPANKDPENTTMAECILMGHCGCTAAGHAYATTHELPHSSEHLDAIRAGDGTLHGAIDYWQRRSGNAELELAHQRVMLDDIARGFRRAIDELIAIRRLADKSRHHGIGPARGEGE